MIWLGNFIRKFCVYKAYALLMFYDNNVKSSSQKLMRSVLFNGDFKRDEIQLKFVYTLCEIIWFQTSDVSGKNDVPLDWILTESNTFFHLTKAWMFFSYEFEIMQTKRKHLSHSLVQTCYTKGDKSFGK